MSRYLISALALMVALAPSASFAGDSKSSIFLEGYVPVICNAQFNGTAAPAPGADGGVQLGQVSEFCNSAHGYELIVTHSAGDGLGELIVDGRHVPLSATGETIIASDSGPAAGTMQVDYVAGDTELADLQISIVARA